MKCKWIHIHPPIRHLLHHSIKKYLLQVQKWARNCCWFLKAINGPYYEWSCNVVGESVVKHLKCLKLISLHIILILAIILLVLVLHLLLYYNSISSSINTNILYLLSPYYIPGTVLNILPKLFHSFLMTHLWIIYYHQSHCADW